MLDCAFFVLKKLRLDCKIKEINIVVLYNGDIVKKILILGAGVYQVPLIKAAKELGLYVIIVSIPGNYPGFSYADKIYYINTTDYINVLDVAKKEEIDAVATTGTDVAVLTLGYVCQQMNLPGLSFEAAKKATDKALMKQAFLEGGVNTSPFMVVSTMTEALSCASEIGYPVMLKIVDKSGSRGITKVSSQSQLRDAYDYALKYTDSDHMIVEGYVDGKEIGIDAFVQDGKVKLILPHEKLVYFSKRTGIPKGHICPMEISETVHRNIIDQTNRVIKALSLDNCAVNIDAFIKNDGTISIIEATGRCGATGIPEVISAYSGVDYYKAILRNSLGEIVDFPEDGINGAAASYLLHSEREGILESIQYEYDGREYRDVDIHIEGKADIHLDDKPGNHILEFTNGTERIGQAIFHEKSLEELKNTILKFDKSIKVTFREEEK